MTSPRFSLPFLKAGDAVCLVSPSFKALEEDVLSGIKALENMGLRVFCGKNIFSNWGSFSGSDEERLQDLQWALDHPDARAVLCVRGGYGMSRILPQIEWKKFQDHPKWLVGFSDISLLHMEIGRLGFPSVHGLMAARYGSAEFTESSRMMRNFLFGEIQELRYPVRNETGSKGDIQAILWGGNLTMVAHSIGSGAESGSEDLILFLEEVGEAYYRIDRSFRQIACANTLNKRIKAVILGQFTDCPENGFPLQISGMAAQAFSGVPVFSGLPCGHGNPNFPLVMGFPAQLEMQNQEWQLCQYLGLDV